MPKKPAHKAAKAKPKKEGKAHQPAAWPRMVDHLAQVILRNSLLELAAVDPAERDLACVDLEDELRSRRRKSMRRNLTTGKCEILSSAHYEKRQIALVDYKGVWRAEVYERQGPRWGSWDGPRDDAHVYFVSAGSIAAARESGAGGRPPSFKSKQIIAELQTRTAQLRERPSQRAEEGCRSSICRTGRRPRASPLQLGTIRKHMATQNNNKTKTSFYWLLYIARSHREALSYRRTIVHVCLFLESNDVVYQEGKDEARRQEGGQAAQARRKGEGSSRAR